MAGKRSKTKPLVALVATGSKTKPLVTLVATVFLCVGVSACGDSGKGSGSASRASSATGAGEASSGGGTSSAASSAGSPEGANTIVDYGQPASAADEHAVAALVRRYYAAAAVDDGAKACALIYSIFKESIPEDYGQSPGPPGLRGKTCATVMTKLFKQRHSRRVSDLAALRVTGVRVRGRKGFALLALSTPGKRYISLEREHGTWRIDALVDVAVPST